jgi:UDP-glucose 4-epimerase
VKLLVTGGAGFIGHHLVRALLARGDEVVVLDNFSTGFPERLIGLEDARLVAGDIRDRGAVGEAVAGCDVILHQAALASVARSVADPVETDAVNAGGTIRVMLAAAEAGVRRVVFAASSSVYGVAPGLPRVETQLPDPRSPYATSKLASEHYLHALGAIHGVETVALRYFNIFGPGQDPASEYAAVIPRFVTAILAGKPPVVFGTGEQTRDFTYIDNVVHANLLAAEAAGVSGLTANVGCGGRYSLLELLDAIAAASGVTDIEPRFEPERSGDVPHSQADISLARERLGYEVRVGFQEGVQRTVAWYRAARRLGDQPGGVRGGRPSRR